MEDRVIDWQSVYVFTRWAETIGAEEFRAWVLACANCETESRRKVIEALSARYAAQVYLCQKIDTLRTAKKARRKLGKKRLESMIKICGAF